MSTDAFWIKGPWPGRLAIASRPRGGDWLSDELKSWKAAGVGKVISTLTDAETGDLELQAEEAESLHLSIEFESFPIGDRDVPDVACSMSMMQKWEAELDAGKSLVVHCRQGIGRSSLVAVSLLVLAGVTASEAWRRVEAARGRPVPDTEEQKRWVDRLLRYATLPH